MGIADKFNLLEALLWFVTGAFVLAACGRHFAPRYHLAVRATGALLLLLGCASLAEFTVAAISAPPWLFAWKALNVGALLVCVISLFWRHTRSRRG